MNTVEVPIKKPVSVANDEAARYPDKTVSQSALIIKSKLVEVTIEYVNSIRPSAYKYLLP